MRSTIHGYPRQGPDRQLKKAIEGYWKGRLDHDALASRITEVRLGRLRTMIEAGLDEIPVGDFSCYDHVLDTAMMVGALPGRAAVPADTSNPQSVTDHYFALARGTAEIAPLEMTKWFDTNYHYLVPELSPETRFSLDATPLLGQITEAQQLGAKVRAIVLGPATFLACSRFSPDGSERGSAAAGLLEPLLETYAELLGTLADRGVEWVQFDEPIAVTDLDAATAAALTRSYQRLPATTHRPKILVASYFGALGPASDILANAPIEGLGIDLSPAGKDNLADLQEHPGLASKRLIAGVVDGRQVWRTDLDQALELLRTVQPWCAQLDVAPSSSLLHVPHDASREQRLDPRLRAQLAFADQKLEEVVTLARGLRDGDSTIAPALTADRERRAARAGETWLDLPEVQRRAAQVTEQDSRRAKPYQERVRAQHQNLQLPAWPTTTIGSFPQTTELRQARADLRRGRIDSEDYTTVMRHEVDRVIELQEQIGLDVLVHGEPERNDMVQYFADQLTGIFATDHGWVQSYGTRCVRPPLIAGDVTRIGPMTVEWSRYAQSRTSKPVKGMLTGPVTMLAWSFVRDDQPLAATARQLALALRDEVADLEAAGIGIVQVDEPGLRELLPLRRDAQPDYLTWAVEAFRLATGGAADSTQIHTHMCYAEFGDIMAAIDALDADVISLEAARSGMAVVAELTEHGYRRQVGPGVWDIHSPRVPSAEAVVALAETAATGLDPHQLWLNPDCGLKTRGYAEVVPALEAIVSAARTLRGSA